MKRIKAAGGVVFRIVSSESEPRVLLIFRRNVWDLPKGKLEPDEDIEQCAVREVSEEVGIESKPHVLARLTDTYHEYERDEISFGKTTYWYVMELTSDDDPIFHPQKEEGIESVKWQPLNEAKELVGYKNLVDVLQSFESWYEKSDQAGSIRK